MNRETRAQLRAARLAEASRKVRDESMRVNAEFAAIEHDPDALSIPASGPGPAHTSLPVADERGRQRDPRSTRAGWGL